MAVGVSSGVRIAGVPMPVHKHMNIALTKIHGIGRSRADVICDATGVARDAKMKDLSEAELNKVREYIKENYKVEGDLRRDVRSDIKRLTDIRCYRGIRHQRGLPLRGQRTKTNARTRKGRRKVAIKNKD